MGHWDQIYQQSRAFRAALGIGGRQVRPGRPRLGGADHEKVDAIFSRSVCPACLDFTPVGVACVRCEELGVDVASRKRVHRAPWYLAGVRALSALRTRATRWKEHATDAPDAVAASADGWVRLRGRVRAVGDDEVVAIVERERLGGQAITTADVRDFELVDDTGNVLVGAQALSVEVIVGDLEQGRWRREIMHGEEVVLVADVHAFGDGPHRTAPRRVVSSVQRPALLFVGGR